MWNRTHTFEKACCLQRTHVGVRVRGPWGCVASLAAELPNFGQAQRRAKMLDNRGIEWFAMRGVGHNSRSTGVPRRREATNS